MAGDRHPRVLLGMGPHSQFPNAGRLELRGPLMGFTRPFPRYENIQMQHHPSSPAFCPSLGSPFPAHKSSPRQPGMGIPISKSLNAAGPALTQGEQCQPLRDPAGSSWVLPPALSASDISLTGATAFQLPAPKFSQLWEVLPPAPCIAATLSLDGLGISTTSIWIHSPSCQNSFECSRIVSLGHLLWDSSLSLSPPSQIQQGIYKTPFHQHRGSCLLLPDQQ